MTRNLPDQLQENISAKSSPSLNWLYTNISIQLEKFDWLFETLRTLSRWPGISYTSRLVPRAIRVVHSSHRDSKRQSGEECRGNSMVKMIPLRLVRSTMYCLYNLTVNRRTCGSAYAYSSGRRKNAEISRIHKACRAFSFPTHLRKRRQISKYLAISHFSQADCPLCG